MFYFLHQVTLSLLPKEHKQQHQQTTSTTPKKYTKFNNKILSPLSSFFFLLM